MGESLRRNLDCNFEYEEEDVQYLIFEDDPDMFRTGDVIHERAHCTALRPLCSLCALYRIYIGYSVQCTYIYYTLYGTVSKGANQSVFLTV